MFSLFSFIVSSGDEAASAHLLHKTARTHPSASPAAHQRPQTCAGEPPLSPRPLSSQPANCNWQLLFFYRCLPLSLFSSQKLIRLCGEVLAAPTENEEIQFLCIVCAKLKQDPYLVNFFLEVGPLPWPWLACRVPYLKTFAFSAEQVEASRGGENQRGRCGEGRRRGSGHGSVSGGGASEAPGGAAGCSGRIGLGLQSNQQQQQRQQLQPRHLAA